MVHDRIGAFTTTLLADGRVLLAGGYQNITPSAASDAEIYNPGSGSFAAAVGPMNAARAYHSAVLMANGQVFLAGGENDTGFLTSTEYFDPVTNTFVVNVGSQPEFVAPREEHSGTRLADTRVLHAGGSTLSGIVKSALNTAEISAATMTGTGLLTGTRRIHTATPLNDGTVLLAGGAASAGVEEGVLNTAEIFHLPVYVDPTPSFALLDISNVELNGGGNVLVLPGGGSFTLEHDYFIANPEFCPTCIDQIEVGLAGSAQYQACTFDGIPPVSGITGHGSATLTVPSTPGLYYVAFDYAATFFCGQFPNWWSGPPGPSRYMAIVIVP
jgi:hypothetical protein